MVTFFKAKRIETICFFLFLLLWGVMAVFHEPWYDEIQAWQIARFSYWKDLFFSIPHYEGHPPLWHVFLAVPARLGVPFEWGFKLVGLLFSAVAAFLVFFKSPFPRWLRCTIPFTYFLCFQYSVIIRPYAIMYVGFLLAAITFAYKDEHPGWFVGSLALLTTVHAYGIVLCCGICLAWLWDIKNEYGSVTAFLKNSWRDKRLWWLAGLFVLACTVIAAIWPKPDTFALNYVIQKTPLWNRLVYAFLMLPADAFFSDAWGIKTHSIENYYYLNVLIPTAFIGVVVWSCLVLLLPKKQFKYLWLPSVLFLLIVAFCYAYHHHIGIFVLLVLFSAWIARAQPGPSWWDELSPRLVPSTRNVLKKTFYVILFIAIGTGLVWTAADMVADIRYPFSASRDTAKFIKQHHLDRVPLFASWTLVKKGENEFFQEIFHVNGAMLPAYFGRNIISNLNDGVDHLAYSSHRWPTQEEIDTYFAKWRADGLPEILFGREGFSFLFPEVDFFKEYAPVYKVEGSVVWKMYLAPWRNITYLYMRRDVMDKYGLKEVENESIDSRIGHILIEDEMS